MASSKYQVGDKLRIRQWDDMLDEYGLISDSTSINVPLHFSSEMRYLCGAVFTVKSITPYDTYIRYFSYEDTESGWSISEEMLEPFEVPINIASSEFFDEMLI